jgi:predicted Zn-ribbon and HTH transcriptional regulator
MSTSFRCPQCSHDCLDEKQFKYHMTEHMRVSGMRWGFQDSSNPSSCPACTKIYLNGEECVDHMYRMHGIRPVPSFAT